MDTELRAQVHRDELRRRADARRATTAQARPRSLRSRIGVLLVATGMRLQADPAPRRRAPLGHAA